jgi:nucleoside-diphosphate-sugar epimerase
VGLPSALTNMDVALVIAGRSFVGRHLCTHLAIRGISYQATSRQAEADCLPCDICRPGAIDAVLEAVRPRWIFACAGVTGHSGVAKLHAVHVAATERLLRASAQQVPDAVVVLMGSAAEYGPVAPVHLPIDEDIPARPQSDYGRSKRVQTARAARLAARLGLRVHVVRPFNLIGAGLGTHFFASALAKRLRQAKQRGEHGAIAIDNGAATRDWVDVDDAADAMLRLAFDAPPARGVAEIYNIATGQETPVLELAEYLCWLAGDFHAVDAGSAGSRSGIDRSCGDWARLHAATGWRPTVPWQRSVQLLWEERSGPPLAG